MTPLLWLPEVLAELARAREAHPDPDFTPLERMACLQEEVGELQQAVNDFYFSGGSWERVTAEAHQAMGQIIRLLEEHGPGRSHDNR